jgi:hypothetical protein
MDSSDEADRSHAIGAGMGLGVGIGAGWGLVMASLMDGDLVVGLTVGAGAGLVIALVSGAAVYRMVTS